MRRGQDRARVHDDRPFRVLACSNGVAMYDAWWPHLGNWGLANLGEVKRRRVNYYVATASTLADKATFVRSEPLTETKFHSTGPIFRSLLCNAKCCRGLRNRRAQPRRQHEAGGLLAVRRPSRSGRQRCT